MVHYTRWIVSYGPMDREYRQLCSRCFNTELAKLSSLDEVIGDPEDDLLTLLRRLIEKMRRAFPSSTSRTVSLDCKSPNIKPACEA
jgi:hypothetical protein